MGFDQDWNGMFEGVLQAMSEAVYVRDLDMNILYINRTAEELCGMSSKEALGRKCHDLFGDAGLTCKEVCPAEEAISRGLPILHREGTLKTRGGEVRSMEVSISPLRERERLRGAVVVLKDITLLRDVEKTRVKALIALEKEMEERRRAEAALIGAREALEQRVDKRTAELATANERLKKEIEERSQAEEEIKRQAAQLGTLHTAGLAVSSGLTLEDVFATVVKSLSEVFDYRLIGIYLMEDEVLHLRAHAGYSSPPAPEIARVTLDKGVIGRTARTGERQLVTRVGEDPDFFFGAPGITSEVCIPLKEGDRLLGVLNVETNRTDRPLDASDLQLLSLLSNYIVIAIEKAQLYNELQQELADRKQAEEAMRKSEARYKLIAENITDLIAMCDVQGNFSYVSPSYNRILGRDPESLLGEPIYKLVHPEDLPHILDLIARHRSDLKPASAVFRLQHASGTYLWFECHGRVVTDGGGRSLGAVFNTREITEKMRVEEALRKSEERYRTLVERVREIIFMQDTEYNLTYLSPQCESILGYGPGEGVGKCLKVVITDNPINRRALETNDRVIRTGIPPEHPVLVEVRGKDGRKVLLELEQSPLRDGQGKVIGLVGSARDVTERERAQEERKKLETQLRQAQKMEAIGTLAGGVAHDFNNLLMGIQGRTSLMLLDTKGSHPHFEHLKGIESYVKSASDLTRQLLGFARGGQYEVRPSDINEIVVKSSQMFGRTRKEILIHRRCQEDVWTVDVDRGQIEQVLLNLYVNAWQSMPGGGTLYLETANVHLDRQYSKPYEVTAGNYVRISVTDTGMGMDKVTQERIFEPFFTTKKMGRGTGLGLASAYGIIKKHGGLINVYSEKGHGTTFNVYLPASGKDAVVKPMPDARVLRGTEAVLLVDDEDMITRVGAELLRNLGYRVLTASGGREAVELFQAQRDRLDLVILDMVMPDMGGSETYDKLREIDPEVKVLLSSGYSIEGKAAEILRRGCNGFIQKPFNLNDLSRKLREVLESGGSLTPPRPGDETEDPAESTGAGATQADPSSGRP